LDCLGVKVDQGLQKKLEKASKEEMAKEYKKRCYRKGGARMGACINACSGLVWPINCCFVVQNVRQSRVLGQELGMIETAAKENLGVDFRRGEDRIGRKRHQVAGACCKCGFALVSCFQGDLVEAGVQAAMDCAADAAVEATIDVAVDAGVGAGTDAGMEAGPKAGMEAGVASQCPSTVSRLGVVDNANATSAMMHDAVSSVSEQTAKPAVGAASGYGEEQAYTQATGLKGVTQQNALERNHQTMPQASPAPESDKNQTKKSN
jgi:hypothetical protein